MNLNEYFIVGIIGPKTKDYDNTESYIIQSLLDEAISAEDVQFAIATSMIDIGMNAVAHRWAWNRGIPVIGVTTPKCWEFPCWMAQKRIIVGEDWGDENQSFVAILNALVKFSDTSFDKATGDLAHAAGIKVVDLTKPLEKLSNSDIT